MISYIFKKIYNYILIKFYPNLYEIKIIKKVSSSGSLIEYYSDSE